MHLNRISDVTDLPDGRIILVKDGKRMDVSIDTPWALSAAGAIIKHGLSENFKTKAEVIAFAINGTGWGAAKSGFSAEVKEFDYPSIALR